MEKEIEVILQRSHGLTPSNTVSSLLNTIFNSCYIITCTSVRCTSLQLRQNSRPNVFNVKPQYSVTNQHFDPVARETGKHEFILWLKDMVTVNNEKNKLLNLKFFFLPAGDNREAYSNNRRYVGRQLPIVMDDLMTIDLQSATRFLNENAQVVAELCILLMLPMVYNFTPPYTLVPPPDMPAHDTPSNLSFCNMFFDETILAEGLGPHRTVLVPQISYNHSRPEHDNPASLEPRGILVVTHEDADPFDPLFDSDFEYPVPANALSFAPPAPRTLRDIRDRLAHIKRRTGDARAGAFVFSIVDKLYLSYGMDPEMFRTLLPSQIDTFQPMS